MYTVVIADDEKLICDGIKSVITSFLPELEITQIFHNGTMLYNYLGSFQPDILLLDIEMPGKSGLEIARLIDEQKHKSYVIIITAHHNFEYAKEAIDVRVDAFLTKPFSSHQLLDAIRKAVSHVAQKHTCANDNWTNYRTLLQSLFTQKVDILSYNKIPLCSGTVPLKELLCTEIIFKDASLDNLPPDMKSILINALTECVENDTISYSSFFLENKNNCLSFLIFSKEEPDLDFVPAALKILNNYTGNIPQYAIETYASFLEYYTHASFAKAMDTFFVILASGGWNQAKKQLTDYIQSLSDHHRREFINFLSGRYQITITNLDTESIIQSLKQFTNHVLDSRSGNYIVNSAKDYIAKNYSSCELSLEAIADTLSISSDYLGRIFKKYTGQTFSEYLLNLRMEHAQNLLKTTHLSTIEIAEKVGYSNPTYFRISFKTHFGMTPRQFRLLQSREE